MNVTIVRRALWFVAIFALGYAFFALAAGRLIEFLITTGVFIVLIPVDCLLHREEQERRARARTPFGPLQKWGTRTLRAESPYWEVSASDRNVQVQPIARRAPWWRRLYRRLTPWWVAVLSIALIIPAGVAAPDANAIVVRNINEVIVSVGWDGAACIELVEPDPDTDRATLIRTITCDPEHGVAIGYTAVPGQWVGVDPVEASGVALACSVTVNGDVVLESNGYSAVNCLGTWTP